MRPLLLLALVLALALPAHAEACVPTTSTTSERMIVVELPRNGLLDYLANDVCQVPPGDPTAWSLPSLSLDWDYDGDGGSDNCLFSTWLYIEVNEIPGLQRGDEMRDDTCGGEIQSDSIWF